MSADTDELDRTYIVLVNDEGQYSLWPAHKNAPAGWRDDGFTGSRAECLRHVDEVWTDITPASVRRGRSNPAAS